MPIKTTNDVLTVLGQAVKIDSSLLSSISALKPARGDERLVTKLRSSLAQVVAIDQTELAALTTRWDPERFKRLLTRDEISGVSLKATALRLGTKPCASYFGA
jgi:hypothetical protein